MRGASPGHLARRFFGSLRPGGPGVAEEAWAQRWLSPAEREIWSRMSGPDRRHAVGVARKVAQARGNTDGAAVPTRLLAAALLHDAGKASSGLGTFGRVGATVMQICIGRERVAGWPNRAGLYAAHDRIGAEMLERAGSDPLVVTWAREHHLPPNRWTADATDGALLKAADG